MQKTMFQRLAFWARNLWFREMFPVISLYAQGQILDVGGRDFYNIVRRKGVRHDRWVSVEYSKEHLLRADDPRYTAVMADGCRLCFKDDSFDTVFNIDVLEHVFEPIKMFQEIIRVLNPGGHAIVVMPQTCGLHESPHHYYNFTRFWMVKAAERMHLEIVLLKPMGGVFSTMAFQTVYFFLQVFRVRGYTSPEYQRTPFFFILMPFMIVYALVQLPFYLLFSLGDLPEGANKHMVVVRKPERKIQP